MKNLFCAVLAVMMALCVSAAFGEETLYNDVTYLTTYQDSVGQRAVLTLEQHENGEAYGVIEWANSADETVRWSFSLNFEDSEEAEALEYDDCLCEIVSYSESSGGEQARTVYEYGTGALIFDEDGFRWRDDREDAGKDCRFEQSGDIFAVSHFTDQVSGRAHMVLRGEASFDSVPMMVTISWADSASEGMEWNLSVMTPGLDYDDDSDFVPMTYTDCVCSRVVYGEDGSRNEEVLWDGGSGRFEFVEIGDEFGYAWYPDNEMTEEPCVFLPDRVPGPVMTD